MSELRDLIREVLAEELGRMGAAPQERPQITEELVTIRSNADLAAFVKRLLRAAQDGRLRADIEAGRHVFRLADTASPAPVQAHMPHAPTPGACPPVRFERGLVSERDVASLPAGTRTVRLGKTARLTPLARDELRRRGIEVERSDT